MRTECEYISKRQDGFSSRETERSDLGGARWGGVEEEGNGRGGEWKGGTYASPDSNQGSKGSLESYHQG